MDPLTTEENKAQSQEINVQREVHEADLRIRNFIRETPLDYSPFLSKLGKCQVNLKLENLQVTGSFKARGAFNKILSLNKNKDVIAASSGNHGLAVAYALQTLNGTGTIYLPRNTAQTKIESLNYYDVQLEFFGSDCVETEKFARSVATKKNKPFISPYNDVKIVGGQGTIAVEIVRQLQTNIDVLLASVGGGGLISGIAGYLKDKNPNIQIIGCLPANSAVMYESLKAGIIVEMESKPTLSDGTAGGIEKNSITFELCQRYVDQFILVSEEEIANAIKFMLQKHQMVVEGAAGVTIAAYLQEKEQFEGKNVVLVICGGNIAFEQLRNILCDSNQDK